MLLGSTLLEYTTPFLGRCLIRVLSNTLASLEPDDAGRWLLNLLEMAQRMTSPKLILEEASLYQDWFLLPDLSPELRDSIVWVPPPEHRRSHTVLQIQSRADFLHPSSFDIRRYMT